MEDSLAFCRERLAALRWARDAASSSDNPHEEVLARMISDVEALENFAIKVISEIGEEE